MTASDATRTPESFLPMKPVVFEILLAVAEEARHGYAILSAVRTRSGGRVKLETGPLYRHLKRLLDDGLVEETEPADESERSDPRRRYYCLTSLGRQVVAAEGRRLLHAVRHVESLGEIVT